VGRLEGADEIKGAPEVGGLGILIPYSYNVQDPILLRREDVEPGLLKLRAARPFLVERPDPRRLVMQEAGVGRTAVWYAVELLQQPSQVAQDGREFGWPFLVVVPLGSLEVRRDLHPPHGHRREAERIKGDGITTRWRIITKLG